MSHNDFQFLFSFSTVAYGIIFSFHFSSTTIQKSNSEVFAIRLLFICIFYGSIHIWLYIRIINLTGGIEKNLGTRPNSSQNFSICHWSLNSITAHSYVKIYLLKVYLSNHKFDIVCVSEAYLDTSVPLHDVNLEI